MKPLFTIHVGEFVAGDYIERTFRRVNVWVPTKDTGVDLLVSDRKNKKALSLQVKSLPLLPTIGSSPSSDSSAEAPIS